MRLGKFVKTPSEVKRYSVEYSDWLDTGEFLQSATLNASVVPGAPLIVVKNAIGASTTKLTFLVSGGVDGATYTVEILATTTGGQVKEDTILFVVRDE